jgi:hypothetical protein
MINLIKVRSHEEVMAGIYAAGRNMAKSSTVFKKLPKDHEYEWDRVQRLRADGCRLMLGGNYVDIPKPKGL